MKISLERLKEIIMEEVARAATTEELDPVWGGAADPKGSPVAQRVNCKKIQADVEHMRQSSDQGPFAKRLLQHSEEALRKHCSEGALEETTELVDDE